MKISGRIFKPHAPIYDTLHKNNPHTGKRKKDNKNFHKIKR